MAAIPVVPPSCSASTGRIPGPGGVLAFG
jgi:hypothetical protein